MIIKKIKYTHFTKSKGYRIGNLADCIRNSRATNVHEKLSILEANFLLPTHIADKK